MVGDHRRHSFRIFARSSGPVHGAIAFSTLTLTPSKAFSAGETVLVNLSHDVHAADSTTLRSAGYAFSFIARSRPATRNFSQIDVMSNRINGAQTRIYGAVQADLDGDGWIDLATVNEVSADLRVFMNKGDGSGLYDPFLRPPFPIGLEASPNEPADFDGDGKVDAALANSFAANGAVLRGNGDGTLGLPDTLPVPGHTPAIDFGDLDW
jgi:hypothetical protein